MKPRFLIPVVAGLVLVQAACGGSDPEPLPQLAGAQAGTLTQCSTLSTFTFANTTVTAASLVAAGTLNNGGQPVGEHCLVTGRMNDRVSSVDGQAYAIGFQMRLPRDWSGRYLYQGNGGIDGVVSTADGGLSIGSGGLLRNGLQMGFAIISSDAGHSSAQNPLFGRDPQARLDFGYQAVGTLTPMAKALIRAAYGRGPDRSYIAGTSNGGRHVMVAAARYASDYDGFLATAPGFNLPKAAVANLWSAQQFDAVATTRVVAGQPDYESAFPQSERRLVANAVLARCDALDGVADGLVQDIEACRSAFDLARDVPTCAGARDGSTCLSSAQKTAIAKVFAGARNSAGTALYNRFPFDAGVVQTGWGDWKLRNNLRTGRDPVAVGFIFTSPPMGTTAMATDPSLAAAFALAFDMDTDAPKIFATSGVYTESAMSFMTPPQPTQLDTLRGRGAKLMVFHGASDGIFSVDDTADWYQALDARYQGAGDFARFFRVPGMGHSRGGPSTDQFDGLSALIDWVEKGVPPERIVASARGPGNPGGVNAEVPSTWSSTRTRPLCPYPLVARYRAGDVEAAASFACER